MFNGNQKKENNPWKFMIHDDGLLTLVDCCMVWVLLIADKCSTHTNQLETAHRDQDISHT